MPLIELYCKKCGTVKEELVAADGKYPKCSACGGELVQKYSGKCYVNGVKKGSCNGNCKTCGGCG